MIKKKNKSNYWRMSFKQSEDEKKNFKMPKMSSTSDVDRVFEIFGWKKRCQKDR